MTQLTSVTFLQKVTLINFLQMLSNRSFSEDWIRSIARETGAQEVIVEKCIHALALVGSLREAGLDFVFKGGTSLMLHFDPARRLSIDVDIASLEPLDRVEAVLNRICDGGPFQNWAHQNWRDGENPPTKYFQIGYRSPLTPDVPAGIQLDVLVTETPHPVIEERPVRTRFVEVERELTVRVPSAECLLGDKLSAFAPTTIGILYEPVHKFTGEPTEPRPIRVAKQLFDVGALFSVARDTAMVARSYDIHFEHQNRYRGGKFTRETALEDTLAAAWLLSQTGLKYGETNAQTKFLSDGAKALNTHLLGGGFSLNQAKTAAAKAALLATILKVGRFDESLESLGRIPEDMNVLRELRIDGRWNRLHTLRKTNLEAFYFWHLAHLYDAGMP